MICRLLIFSLLFLSIPNKFGWTQENYIFVDSGSGILSAECTKDRETVIEYFDSGKVRVIGGCNQGVKEGWFQEFYPHGGLKFQMNFRMGRRNGLLLKYDSMGKLVHELKFLEGSRVTNYERRLEYYENGNLKSEYYFDSGHGFRSEYLSSGKISKYQRISFNDLHVTIDYAISGEVSNIEYNN